MHVSTVLFLLLLREFCQSALRSDYWTTVDTRQALEDLTANDLESFVEEFYNGMFVEGLVEGNLSIEVCLQVFLFLTSNVKIDSGNCYWE